LKYLYDDKSHDKFVKLLKSGADDPPQSVARVSSLIIKQVDKDSKGKIPETAIIHAGGQIMAYVMELAQAMELLEGTEAEMGRAADYLMKDLGESYGVEPEDLAGIVDSIAPDAREQIGQQHQGYWEGVEMQGVA
jgi:hypothetical protein